MTICHAQIAAAVAAESCSSQCKQITTSVAAFEECIGSAAAVDTIAHEMLEKEVRFAVRSVAEHSEELLSVPALEKSLYSLLITCLKLPQAYSSVHAAEAALLSHRMFDTVVNFNSVQSILLADPSPSASRSARAAAKLLECTVVLAGRSLFVPGTILQQGEVEVVDGRNSLELGKELLADMVPLT